MVLRIIDAYCHACGEPQAHVVSATDPGSCQCHGCGEVQQLVTPIDAVEA